MKRGLRAGTPALCALVVVLALAGSAGAGGSPPRSVLGVACSDVSALHLDRQTNVRAYLVLRGCGVPGAKAEQPTGGFSSPLAPSPLTQIGGTDRDVVNPPDASPPHDTQAWSAVAADGNTVVVAFQDSAGAPSDYSGASVSTNGGTTWQRFHFGPGHGSNYGEPILAYDQKFGEFVAGYLVAGCGGFGIGLWTSPDGLTWSPGACAHNGSSDDGPFLTADNDPASPYYGNLYLTWNDFNIGGGALVVSVSSNGGASWSGEHVISSTFLRNTVPAVQRQNGQVDLVGVDEGGGGLSNRTNWFFRSTDGGVTWSSPISMGSPFPAGGDTTSGYFAGYHHIWRAMGEGNAVPAGASTIVYPYYQHGAGTDVGDVYAVRSVDGGLTWSSPFAISTAANAQWGSQAVSNGGGEVAIWYYSRENTTNGDNYEVFASRSHDGGATWSAPARLSDALIDEPVQNDPSVQPFFAGWSNVTTTDLTAGKPSNRLFTTWTDGRNTLTPAPGNYDFTASSGSVTPGGADVGNHCDDCATQVTLPFPVAFYGTSYTSAFVSSNGLISFGAGDSAYANSCLPGDGTPKIAAFWDDLTTQNAAYGWFETTSGSPGSRVFTLRETAQFFGGTGLVDFEVRFHEGSPSFEIVYGSSSDPGSSATVGAEAGSRSKQVECNAGGLGSGLEEDAVFNPTEPNGGGSVHTEDVELDRIPLNARIVVRKVLAPSSDSGRFDLLVGATTVKSAAGNGDSGAATVGPGTYTVAEHAASGSLADYTSSITCRKNGSPDVSGSGTSIQVTVAAEDVEACTITNTRKARITLRKALRPVTDAGRFDLLVGNVALASSVGNGGSGSGSFKPGTYTVRETGAGLGNYVSSIACTLNGGAGPSGSGTSLRVTVAVADVLDCTFTNVRKARITVRKALRPSTDQGTFDLRVDATVVKAAAGDGGVGSAFVAPGHHTVRETGANGTPLSSYTSSIACTKNGNADVSGPGTSIAVTVGPADVEACTITNVRK